jgi:hypothetical protein
MSFTLLCHHIYCLIFFYFFLHQATHSHFDYGVGYVHTEYGLVGETLLILYKPCEILFSFICDDYVLTRVNLRLLYVLFIS